MKKEVDKYLSQVKNEFISLHPEIPSPTELDLTFVGVHARRADYHTFIRYCCQGQLVSTEFYNDAMTELRNRHGPNVVFIWASDDVSWVKEYFGHRNDVFLVNAFKSNIDRPILDMATLASCNHSIIR